MDALGRLEDLQALIADPPRVQFREDMHAAASQIWMYVELHKARGVESSEDLLANHGDLFWVTRASVVTSFSALDKLLHALLRARLEAAAFERVRFKTFQSAAQIEKAMSLIGITDIYTPVAKHYSLDIMTPDRLRETLDSFYDRKNLITHHVDSDELGARFDLPPAYAHECYKFVGEFGVGLHSVVFAT